MSMGIKYYINWNCILEYVLRYRNEQWRFDSHSFLLVWSLVVTMTSSAITSIMCETTSDTLTIFDPVRIIRLRCREYYIQDLILLCHTAEGMVHTDGAEMHTPLLEIHFSNPRTQIKRPSTTAIYPASPLPIIENDDFCCCPIHWFEKYLFRSRSDRDSSFSRIDSPYSRTHNLTIRRSDLSYQCRAVLMPQSSSYPVPNTVIDRPWEIDRTILTYPESRIHFIQQ